MKQSIPPLTLEPDLSEKCAVIGVSITDTNQQFASEQVFYGLCALQHRGQESSGIASFSNEKIYSHIDNGLVSAVYHQAQLDNLPGKTAIGHNRYTTSGSKELCAAQPLISNRHNFSLAHNGNLPDVSALMDFIEVNNIDISGFQAKGEISDTVLMFSAIEYYLDQGMEIVEAIKTCYPLFTGVFSCVALYQGQLLAFRDSFGVRPLSIGKLPNGYAIASESCAFDTIGAKLLRDITPGEIIQIQSDELTSYQVEPANQKLDIFEFVYFARPDSKILGKRVNTVRENFGIKMAQEFSIDADLVIPVPDSAIPAAIGYSKESKIPFQMALIKNRYIHRTFISPNATSRQRDLNMKLNPITELIENKKVILVDDSIVRGTTMKHIVKMVKDAGATEVHVIITCPEVKFPDFYGINTPDQRDLLSATMPPSKVSNFLGATSVHFLSFDGMLAATELDPNLFSTSCFNGIYPVDIKSRSKEFQALKPNEFLND